MSSRRLHRRGERGELAQEREHQEERALGDGGFRRIRGR